MTAGEYLRSKSSLLVGTALEFLQNISSGGGSAQIIEAQIETSEYDVSLVESVMSVNELSQTIEIEEVKDEIDTL